MKRQLVEKICEINPVTNIQGKGRNDFKHDILTKAEQLHTQPHLSRAVKKISEQVISTFQLFRTLIRKYSENIEVVDPMLRNNQELSDVMGDLEKSWSVARDQLSDAERQQHL